MSYAKYKLQLQITNVSRQSKILIIYILFNQLIFLTINWLIVNLCSPNEDVFYYKGADMWNI